MCRSAIFPRTRVVVSTLKIKKTSWLWLGLPQACLEVKPSLLCYIMDLNIVWARFVPTGPSRSHL